MTELLHRAAVKGAYVVCRHPVNGLRYGGVYMVIEVLTNDPLYYGNCIRLFDVANNIPAPDNEGGYFPWRFEVSVWPK